MTAPCRPALACVLPLLALALAPAFAQSAAPATPATAAPLNPHPFVGPIQLANMAGAREATWACWKAAADAAGWRQLWPAPQPVENLAESGRLNAATWRFGQDDLLLFAVLVKGERPEHGWPLFWCTHGGGSNPETPTAHGWPVNSQEWLTQIQLAASLYDSPGIYFVPRMMDDRRGRWWMATEQQAWEQMIRLGNLYGDIDPNRVYYLGISEGGYGSHRLAAFHGDLIAGAGPMAGCEPLENAPLENLRNTPFRMEIGEGDGMFDRNKLVHEVHDRLGQLAAENPGDYDHEVNIQAGRGHGIDYSLVVPWLATKVRTPLPAHLSWTDWSLDNRRRRDFGWVGLEDLPAEPADGRAVLDVRADRDSNSVTVTSQWRDTWDRPGEPLAEGTLSVYLSDELLDLDQPVTITVDGAEVFQGTVPRSQAVLFESCQRFADPARLMPAKVTVNLAAGEAVAAPAAVGGFAPLAAPEIPDKELLHRASGR